MKFPILQLKQSIQLPNFNLSNSTNNTFNDKLSSPDNQENQFSNESLSTPNAHLDGNKMGDNIDSKAHLKSCISNQTAFSYELNQQQIGHQNGHHNLHHQNQSSESKFFYTYRKSYQTKLFYNY